jgi:hypothetical protein
MKAALFIIVRNLAISAGLLICEVQEGNYTTSCPKITLKKLRFSP